MKERRVRLMHRARRFVLPAVSLALLLAVFVTLTYNVIASTAADIVSGYLDELAVHDMNAVRGFVQDRWTMMEGICAEMRTRNTYSLSDFLDELRLRTENKMTDHLYLIDESDNLYSDTRTVYNPRDNEFLQFVKENENSVCRYDDYGRYTDDDVHMCYIVSFKDNPLKLDGFSHEFVAMVMLNNIMEIRERMGISSFDGRGYASIINEAGQYIVTENGISTPGKHLNFFDVLRGVQIRGHKAEDVIAKIEAGENISFWYTGNDGVQYFVSVRPVEGYPWSFISTVERSVYFEQLKRYAQLMTIVLASFFLVILIVGALVLRSRRKLKKMYSGVVPGVYNRKYYDEKILNKRVGALAIMDLDDLKKINDRYGHLAGDMAIAAMARAIFNNVNPGTEVCRYGGDEFVAAFYNITEEDFEKRLVSMRDELCKTVLEEYPEVKLSLCIGGCYASGVACEVIKTADKYLYEAKRKQNKCSVVTGK